MGNRATVTSWRVVLPRVSLESTVKRLSPRASGSSISKYPSVDRKLTAVPLTVTEATPEESVLVPEMTVLLR